MAEDSKDKIIQYLEDLYAAEQGGLKSMDAIIAEATDPEFRSTLTEHRGVTELQAQRVEARITALGGKVNAGKNVLDSIISIGSHFTNIFHDKEDKQTQDCIKSAALEEFEVGAYTSLKAYASAVGDMETADLAEAIIGEERLARERLEALIPQVARMALSKTA